VVGGQTWHMGSQEFGPWVQNSGFKRTMEGKAEVGGPCQATTRDCYLNGSSL
jgi:hypothetical protein